MQSFYLVAKDDCSIKMFIGQYVSFSEAFTYIDSHHPASWMNGWEVKAIG